MTTISDYKKLEKLYEGVDTVVYRGCRISDNMPLVLKMLKAEYPSLKEITGLRLEYEISKSLDLAGTIAAYSLEKYENRLTLVLEDFGGVALNEYLLNHHLDLINFLKIGIQLADILGDLHEKDVIHKDIKPQNILIHPIALEVKITDFSIASRLKREHQAIANPNALQGTLAYMSPEQTGRMNRAIDYRTDFYSLGVTFYQMLTGQLPFPTLDSLALIHAHIAKEPIPPHQKVPEIPKAVSDIIMKLLAKTAEERYQSGQGLKADLESCLDRLLLTGKITNFIPGQQDKCGRFLIPQTLYGREEEVTQLLAAFERARAGNTELVMVSGYSGIGKTSVVNEVHKPIVQWRGYFIEGKFDQLKRNIPYTAIAEAFADLVRQILTESQDSVERWEQEILDAVGPNGQVIVDVIPEVELLIGKQPPVTAVPATEAQNRFNRVFQEFMHVFAREEHPLVMFVDDLQWADSASLKLLDLLIGDPDSQYLLAIAAYRSNEVDATHPFMLTVEEMKKAGAIVNEIALQNLEKIHVAQVVAETIRETQSKAKPLIDLLFHKTQGNPFFLTQLLQSLYDERLLRYDYSAGSWQWDIEEIQAVGITDANVVELMARNIQKLSEQTQEVLKVAACIGNRFNLEVLAIATEQSESATVAQLWDALQVGLILPVSEGCKMAQALGNVEMDADSGEIAIAREFHKSQVNDSESATYKFLHDRVQQAAYSSIPEERKKETHLKLGCLLLEKIDPDEIEGKIFDIVNQLNQGVELIARDSDWNEDLLTEEAIDWVSAIDLLELTRLNLVAGTRAKEATAYETAVRYLTFGIDLLEGESWESDYELSLDLHVEAAEAEYLNTNYEGAAILAEVVLQRANCLLDKVKAYQIQIQLSIAQNQMFEAIEIGLQAIEELGVSLCETPGEESGWVELPSLDEVESLPTMTDPNLLASMQLLIALMPATATANSVMVPRVILTLVNLCIERGHSALAAFPYALYGWILCGVQGDADSGYHAGLVALKLLDRFQAKEFTSKIHQVFHCFIQLWKAPLRDTLAPMLQNALQKGLETGDIEYATYSATVYCASIFLVGEPLDGVELQQGQHLQLALKLKQEYSIYYIQMWNQLTVNLQKGCEKWEELTGEIFDEKRALVRLKASNSQLLLFILYLTKIVQAYLFGECLPAIVAGQLATEHRASVMGMILLPVYNFYSSLSLLGQHPHANERDREQYLQQVEDLQQQMQYWAKSAPTNFQHKYDLVEAEKARVLGQIIEAMELYDRAIAGARQQDYIQEEAIANERAAEFYFALGRTKVGRVYLVDAYYCYQRWGATAKVKDLEVHYPDILSPKRVREPSSLDLTHTTTSTTNLTKGALDLATVMKASQALADEIVFHKLLEKLLKIVMESAGAQTSCFILEKEGQLHIEATGTVDPDEIVLRSHPVYEHCDRLPGSLLNYTLRTRETVVLHHAAKSGRFTTDPYIVKTQPKSVLCVPIVDGGQLIGLLYLENNHTTDAFTADRVEILKILSSQIAISIKNALLYANLAAATEQLTAAKERLEDYSHTLEVRVDQRTQELQQKNEDLQQTLQKLRQTQAQLIQTEKMSSLGQLVAGVAHEINNPVNFIYGNLIHAGEYLEELLDLIDRYEEGYPDPIPEIADCIEEIELDFLKDDFPRILTSMHAGAERIRQIVRSLRNFSRLDEADMKEVNVNEGIESTLEILQHRLKGKTGGEGIAVVKEYGKLPLVECYAGQLNQVFMNVLSNAIDALESYVPSPSSFVPNPSSTTDNKGQMTTTTDKGQPTIRICTDVQGDRILVRIADNGPGMTEEVKSKLFDPFFTTKPVGAGTGLGLSVSYQIVVEKHGGELECHSTRGQGAEFAIAIPLKLRNSQK